MPLSTITATLDNTLSCTINELCSQQQNTTQDASISFTTLLTAGSTLLATIYAAASSSITLSTIKLYSFYSKQRVHNYNQLIDESITDFFNSSSSSDSCTSSYLNRSSTHNSSPTQSEIVSITGALIVFTVLLTTVLLTHLFDAIDDFTRKCCKINVSNLVQIGLGKNVTRLINTIKQLMLDLLITIVLKSSLLTSLFVDEKSLNNLKKLNYHLNSDASQLIELLEESEDDDEEKDEELFIKQSKWSVWFGKQLTKRLIHS